MRVPCDLDVVVIECRLSATIGFGIINGHLSLIYIFMYIYLYVKLPAA